MATLPRGQVDKNFICGDAATRLRSDEVKNFEIDTLTYFDLGREMRAISGSRDMRDRHKVTGIRYLWRSQNLGQGSDYKMECYNTYKVGGNPSLDSSIGSTSA